MNKVSAIIMGSFIWVWGVGFYTTSYPFPFLDGSELQASLMLVEQPNEATMPAYDLRKDAFKILNTRCNVCHRKKNSLMVFSLKNMARRSSKIHQQVFVKRSMPKGDETQLTAQEYRTLKQWLSTQNLH